MIDSLRNAMSPKKEETLRKLNLNSPQVRQFCSNNIKTTKYTFYNFLFKNIYEQLCNPSNLYFVFIAVLQAWPATSSSHGVPIILLPLTIVLLGNAAKDAHEDYQRYLSDNEINFKIGYSITKEGPCANINSVKSKKNKGLWVTPEPANTLVVKNLITQRFWTDLSVGEIILLLDGDTIPADMILLGSSEANGAAFVKTTCLDGESNLKKKEAVFNIYQYLSRNVQTACEKVLDIVGEFVCEIPNKNLMSFDGTLRYEIKGKASAPDSNSEGNLSSKIVTGESVEFPTSFMNFLPRGCRLVNTKWVVGFLVYTGHETKIYMNSIATPHKESRLTHLTSRMTFIVWAFQVMFCGAGAIINLYRYLNDLDAALPYLQMKDKGYSPFRVGIVSFLSWVVNSATVVPISTIMTMNIARIIQALMIHMDADMTAEDGTHAVARTTTLNEELGQIQYLFSDKTGTLTCNQMVFRKFAVAGKSYGRGYTDVQRFVLTRQGYKLEDEPFNPHYSKESHVNLVDENLTKELADSGHPRHTHLVEFLMHMACNHSVLTNNTDSKGNCSYSSSSTDELCFVHAANFLNLKLLDRTSTTLDLSVFGRNMRVRLLASIEFDYIRKCSSAIVGFPLNQSTAVDDPDLSKFRIILFVKGGDNVILKKLANKSEMDQITIQYCSNFSRDGLRTLMFAKRELTVDEYLEWNKTYIKAQADILKREESVAECISVLEQNLELQGVSGIEDKLQDGVPETIELLTLAGIRIWMLTGDNMETANNIGIATNLLTLTSDRIDLHTAKYPVEKLGDALMEYLEATRTGADLQKHRCLIIDGVAANELTKEKYVDAFVELCTFCHTAICCRMTPALKGIIVSLFKNRLKKITLAIGDGGNDCNMIQTAHVGVGIKGQEGLQAFNVSDYGICNFRFLAPLLLNHGRKCYRSMGKTVVYMFYKNITFITPFFYYSLCTLYSGRNLYFELVIALYNVCFTGANVLFLGSVDQDVDKRLSFKYPQLYRLGQKNYYLSTWTFISWILTAFFHSLIIFYVVDIGLGDRFVVPTSDGTLMSHAMFGMALTFIVLIVVSLKLIMETWLFTTLYLLTFVLCFYAFLFTIFGCSLIPKFGNALLGASFMLLSSWRFWIVLLTAVLPALYRDYCNKVLHYSFKPHYYQYVQQHEYLKTI
ncbi:bifunctional P-type ATPase [Babesia duncani]|uniref:Phospholipid-transporting ATPase n=1 Tax=Babesia duncani TaxID=323732 RepID=A0AAD9PK19_9APIC|nr:bifunctional P-type ATPase [Babesia duncani]